MKTFRAHNSKHLFSTSNAIKWSVDMSNGRLIVVISGSGSVCIVFVITTLRNLNYFSKNIFSFTLDIPTEKLFIFSIHMQREPKESVH